MEYEKTPLGTVVGTGAASMDLVILSYQRGQEFNVHDIDAGIRSRGWLNRGAKSSHFNTLRRRGFIRKGSARGMWAR